VAERVFAGKLAKVGFIDVEVFGHRPMSIDDVARFPLYPPELIDLMRRLMPPSQHAEVATSVIVSAERP
jgi:hypothetical protein